MGVLINGVFYWLVENCGKGKEILSFKLNDEELEIIDIPDLTQFKDYLPSFKLITKWKESLAFLSIPIHATDLIRWCDVFFMSIDEIGKKIWTPLFYYYYFLASLEENYVQFTSFARIYQVQLPVRNIIYCFLCSVVVNRAVIIQLETGN